MFYWFFRILTIILVRSFFNFKVEGRKNLPTKTNFIVVANHTSYLDPFVVGTAIPKKIYWVALKDFYTSLKTRWFMYGTGTLPVGHSSEKIISLLIQNKNVGLFPEGTRSRDGKLGEFRRGAALLALRTGRPIVPCAILGTYEALPITAKFPKLFTPIKVKIGKPQFLLKEFDETVDDIYLQEGTFKIRNTIMEMLSAG